MRPTLRLSAAPRSVSDATRFTATMPHASSKAAAPPPRFASPKTAAVPPSPAPGGGPGASGGSSNAGPLLETPEQKVARLRAAHRRAKEAQVSKFDKVVDASRRLFDSAHKMTVAGLVGFTVIATFATAYTAVDMIMHNKKRSAEWVEAQKKIEADSLEAARIAYMTGKATEEQIALVEEQLERERESGRKTSFFSNMPSVLGAPEPSSSQSPPTTTPHQQQQSITETVSWPSSTTTTTSPTSPTSSPETSPPQEKTSLWTWLTANLKREEEGTADDASSPMSPHRRLGYESLSEEDGVVRDSDLARAVGAKAQAALERERERQRKGGPLDRVGVEVGEKGDRKVDGDDGKAGEGEKGGRKGWFW